LIIYRLNKKLKHPFTASSFISSFKNKSSAELGKKVVYPPPEFEKLRTMDEVDAFWEFLFSKHKIDEKRRVKRCLPFSF